jgi:hypothetical protein
MAMFCIATHFLIVRSLLLQHIVVASSMLSKTFCIKGRNMYIPCHPSCGCLVQCDISSCSSPFGGGNPSAQLWQQWMTLYLDAKLRYRQPFSGPCVSCVAISLYANEMSHLKLVSKFKHLKNLNLKWDKQKLKIHELDNLDVEVLSNKHPHVIFTQQYFVRFHFNVKKCNGFLTRVLPPR